MNAFDTFLSKSLVNVIKEMLGNQTYVKIERMLEKKYSVTIIQSFSDFGKLYDVLLMLFGKGADSIIESWIDKLISYDKDGKSIIIENRTLSELILRSFGNLSKKAILQTARHPDTLPNIIKHSRLSRSSGYRLSRELIKDSMLVEDGYIITNDGKSISKYTTLFNDVKIDIMANTIITKVQANKNHIKNSALLKIKALNHKNSG